MSKICIDDIGIRYFGEDNTSPKFIKPNNLFQALSTGIALDTPVLPSNCVYAGRVAGKWILAMEYDPSVVKVVFDARGVNRPGNDYEYDYDSDRDRRSADDYNPDHYPVYDYITNIRELLFNPDRPTPVPFIIPTPRMLHVALVDRDPSNKYMVQRDFLYALKQPVASLDDPLYKCPFGNVYTRDHTPNGDVCWGDVVRFGRFDNLSIIRETMNIYFGLPFNSDLDGNNKWKFIEGKIPDKVAKLVNEMGKSTFTLFAFLHEMKEFPVEMLEEQHFYTTNGLSEHAATLHSTIEELIQNHIRV